MENRLGAILNDPEMMEKIMSLAQSLNESPVRQEENKAPSSPFDQIDMGMLQKLSGMAGRANIDPNQKTLLSALAPYLSSRRISKLERAMRGAKMAAMAGILLNGSGR